MDPNASLFTRLTFTDTSAAVLLIRLYVGLVFASEGILKFLRPDALGTGRFDKAGIPAPASLAHLDGVFEIACGVLILVGLLTRLAAVPMIINMLGALLIIKLPILWGDAPLFRAEAGWWDFIHESRTDLAQLCGSVVLFIVGAGAYSLDARLARGHQTACRHRVRARINDYTPSSPRTSRANSCKALRSSRSARLPACVTR